MNYLNGQRVQVGDRIRIGNDCESVVVCVFDSGEFSHSFPQKEWDYLKEGFLVISPGMGVVHYPKMNPEVKFIGRGEVTNTRK